MLRFLASRLRSTSDCEFGALGKSVAGILAVGGSGLGLWLLPSSSSYPDSSVSFADSDFERGKPDIGMASNDAERGKKTRYLFAGVCLMFF